MVEHGWFALDKIVMKSFNIKFTVDLSPAKQEPFFPRQRDSTSSNTLDTSTDQHKILVWPQMESFDIHVTHYEVIDLDQLNSIKICLATGQNNVISCRLLVRAATGGLRLHTAKAKSLDTRTKITDQSQPGSINIGALPANARSNIIIPYSTETDVREIRLRVMIGYTTLGGETSFSRDTKLPVFLPLAINVQDIFQQAVLVSKFTIGTSSPIPVRISKCQLEGDSDFRVISPVWSKRETDIFVRQPLSLVSKIYRESRDTNNNKATNNRLFLKVEYRCLDQIVYTAVQHCFSAALNESGLQKFQRALEPTLRAKLRLKISAQDLEATCLQGTFSIGNFNEWPWALLLAGLPDEDSQRLEKWLQNWHQVCGSILSTRYRLMSSRNIRIYQSFKKITLHRENASLYLSIFRRHRSCKQHVYSVRGHIQSLHSGISFGLEKV